MYIRVSARQRILFRDNIWTKWRLFTKFCMNLTVLEFWVLNFPTEIAVQIKLATICNKNEQQEPIKGNAEL
jgi:hypothetical protein